MDTAQWPQGIGVLKNGAESPSKPGVVTEKKPRPQKEQALNCPRCNSTNTKFCYYNNYSLSQPRYFCKTCRRYWTDGGSLRNVPVGGGSRKNKRSSSSSSTSSSTSMNSSKKMFSDLSPQNFSPQNPKINQGHDLNLAYNPSHCNGLSGFVGVPFGVDAKNLDDPQNFTPNASHVHHHFPVMELFKTGNMSSGGFSSLMSVPMSDSNSVYSSTGFSAGEFKPSLGFSVDGLENYGNINQGAEDHANSSRILFPFEELKPVADGEFEQDRGQGETNAYWSRMMAGGSW